jgi:hypothetical protein
MARILGATTPVDVLAIVVWLPPIVSAVATAIAVFVIARTSLVAGALAAIGLSCAPFLVNASSIADIDHHFLEPLLALAIAGAATFLAVTDERRQWIASGALAAAIAIALFIQSAMIVAAGLAFAGLFLARIDNRARIWGAVAFAASGGAIAVYRLTRPPAFPDSAWFLGWTHVMLLVTAADALLILALLERSRIPAILRMPVAIAGAIAAMLIVASPRTVLNGFGFIGGGDAYLDSVQEMQPVWIPLDRAWYYLAPIIGGIIAAPIVLLRSLRKRSGEAILAILTLGYIASTLPRRRFIAIASALSVVITARLAAELWRDAERRKRIAAIALGLTVAVLPPLQLAWRATQPDVSPLEGRSTQGFLRAASYLRDRTPGARVLAPWSYGPMLNVIGKQKIVLDNFGSMADPATFRAAHAALTSPDERDVARFCDRGAIRYIVVDAPAGVIGAYAKYAGRDPAAFAEESTWYWRVYYGGPKETHYFRGLAKFGTVIVLERLRSTT